MWSMVDRLLSHALNGVVLMMIASMAAAMLVCGHFGVLRLISGAPQNGAAMLACAAALALAVGFMVHFRNDLVDR